MKNISGRRIASARKRNNNWITQQELSDAAIARGVQLDRAAVAKIENGLRGVLDYELLTISEILGVELDWLLSERATPAAAEPAAPPHPDELEEPAPSRPQPPARDENRALIFL
ncbi:MAG TPA: helix-turn-helix domain-containing protein [Kiritimatiellia bacterium]|nr:helix-turn-helix domain-containing protein [Kiritimatiellia bacterium]HRZ11406.1 helix-turn-helix domain-containing protein [Kiritimatiellia bacterium]HSA17043.1 helix-turn-helix domain-containing protein [Kiritimatiellia bacterium]